MEKILWCPASYNCVKSNSCTAGRDLEITAEKNLKRMITCACQIYLSNVKIVTKTSKKPAQCPRKLAVTKKGRCVR